MKKAALDALTNVVDRVQNRGENAKGTKMAGYSIKPGRFEVPKKDRVKKKRGTGLAKTRFFVGGYWQYRGTLGKENDIVNLTFTGRMLNNLTVLKASDNEAVIGFTRDEEEDKARNTQKLKGVWLDLTPAEQRKLSRIYDRELARVISTSGGTFVIKP